MGVRWSPVLPGRASRSGWTLLSVPLLLIVAVTVVDLSMPATIDLGPLLVAAPAVTASFAGPLVTGVMGACAVVSQVVIGALQGQLMTANHEVQIGGLVIVSLFLALFRYTLDRHGRQLTQVRSVAEAAQQALLRTVPERLGPLRLAAVYDAAEAEARIGGDLYAVIRDGPATRLLIGDVRGKGLGAVADAALLLGAFRSAEHEATTLPQLVEHLERSLTRVSDDLSYEADCHDESFVTAVVVEVPDDEPVLRLISCGHPPPYLLSEGRVTALEVDVPGLPLGVGLEDGLRGAQRATTFSFPPDDLLVLYTDGAIETRNAAGDFYPLLGRLAQERTRSPRRLVQHLHHDLLDHAGGKLEDDVALLACVREPVGPVGGGRYNSAFPSAGSDG